jgi:light-regulated signal transduction histidine kinase (bacteriophytochrome)
MKSVLSRNINSVLAPILALVVGALLSSSALAQNVDVQAKPLTDTDIQMLRQDIQAQKNQIISDTMAFTEAEAAAFWPVYKEYAAAQHAIADKRLALITDYARSYDKMDDATASALTQRLLAIEDETQALRKDYFSRFAKALGAKRAAKFYQVDNRLTLMINLQLAASIPLIP